MSDKPKWHDTTTYSRTAGKRRGECEPKTWELDVSGLIIIVTRWHFGVPDAWYLVCRDIAIDYMELQSDLEASKQEALEWTASELRRLANAYIAAASALDRVLIESK